MNTTKLPRGLRFIRQKISEYLWQTRNRLNELLDPNIVLVYSMPKTGSSTIYASLKAANLPHSVYHTHLFTNNMDEMFEVAQQKGYPLPPKREINEIKRLRELFDTNETKRWKVITLVREPISRCLSSLFQGSHTYLKDVDLGNVTPENLARVQNAFNERTEVCYKASQEWYPQQIQNVLGIDIFGQPFPKEKGYAFYQGPKTNLLLIKLENLDRCYQSAFKDWLGVDQFSMIKTNMAENKVYTDLYKAYCKEVVIPNKILEKMYALKYVLHFYAEDEIATFKARWQQS